MPLGISSLTIITTRSTEAYVVLLRFINCYLVAVFGTALSVRCDTYDAQLDALPKGSIGSQLLSFSRVLTSTAAVMMHKLEQDELITRMLDTKRVMNPCTVGENPSFEDSHRHGSGNPTRRSIGCASAGRILSTHHQNRPLNAWHSLGVKEPHRRQSIHSSYRHC
jgi:hypothetical protein